MYDDVSQDSIHQYLDPKLASGYAVWTIQDVIVLITFLQAYVPGDGHKFKPAVLVAAADHLNQHLIKGGIKKEKGVRDEL